MRYAVASRPRGAHAQAPEANRDSTRRDTIAAVAATAAPAKASISQWLPVTTTTNVTTSGDRAQSALKTLRRAISSAGPAIIRENATCTPGTAAYALQKRGTSPEPSFTVT